MWRATLPDDVEEYRDSSWHREGQGLVQTAVQAERFLERVGFAACLTDSRRPGPSLYVASAGGVMPSCPAMCKRIRKAP